MCLFFQRNPTLRTRPTPPKRRALRRTNERTNERATTKNARRSFRRARSGRRRALVSFASSRCCVFPLSFSQRANWKCQNVTSSVFVPLLFVSSPREKTSADQRNRNARREVGEKMMRPKRAARKKKQSLVAYPFFRTNSMRSLRRRFLCA